MNKLKRYWSDFRVLIMVPLLLLSMSPLAFSQDQAQKVETPKQNEASEVQLEREVMHSLNMLPFYNVFDNLQFQIKNNNTVVLSGQVVLPVTKNDAAGAVRRIKGVKKVENHIEVLPVSPFDSRIRRREYWAIYGTPALQRYGLGVVPSIHIIVKNGDVTLMGMVADKSDKNLAGIVANRVPDVFHVTNDLRVERNG